MHFDPLSSIDRIEKTNNLTNRIIVKALQSDRGDLIRGMNNAELKMMRESVLRAVYNKIAVETQRAYDNFVADPAAKFELIPDVEIEEDVSAYFEIDGKLQYREVEIESISTLEF